MQSRKQGGDAGRAVSVLAGFHLGVAGGLLMLVWFSVSSVLTRQVWWAMFHLFATTLYGDRALDRASGWITLSGMALHVVVSGSLGALYGLFSRQSEHTTRGFLIGVLAGVASYYLLYGWAWKKVNVLVPLYSSDRVMLIGHLLFGMVLGQHGRLMGLWSKGSRGAAFGASSREAEAEAGIPAPAGPLGPASEGVGTAEPGAPPKEGPKQSY
jgi:hypothetical protein